MSTPQIKKDKTPLPYMQVASAFAVQFSEAMNINVLFPFLAFMVEGFGYGGPELGYYAGGLGESRYKHILYHPNRHS